MTTPLANLRVVELTTDPAGEMTGLQFVNAGADVLKIEPPGGAPSRHTGPFVDDIPDPEKSLAYWYYNAGKRSAVLDLEAEADRATLESLLDRADIFLSSLHPIELGQLGLDLAAIAKARPALIVVSVTPFGLTGPWAEYRSSDLVGLAASGLLVTSGYDDHTIPPIRPGGDQAFHTAASFAHIGTMLALIERQQTGCGGLLDVSMHEAAGVTVELANPYWFYPRALVQRQTCRHAQPVPTQPALFECGDGRYVYFALILADQKPWQVLVEWMESQGLATDLTDEAYSDLTHRQHNFSHVQDVVECFFLLQDATTAYHEGQARGLPIGILNAPEDLYDDEHLRERGVFAAVEQPGHGTVLHPVSPYRFSTLEAVAPGPAPRLGEHNVEVGARSLMSGSSDHDRFVDDTLIEGWPDEPVLVGSRCRNCGTVAFPMQASCPRCTGLDVERHALARRGILWSFTTQRFPPKTPYLAAAAPFRPFGVGYVELGGEVRVASRLIADDLESLRIGMPMELALETFHEDNGHPVLTFAFKPTTEG